MELGDEEDAERWIDRAVELSPDSGFSNSALASLRMHQGNETEAILYTKRALREETFSSYWRRLGVLRNADLRDERYKDARERYEQYLPELFDDDPTIDGTNYLAAIDLALVMKLTIEPMRAEELLNGSFDYIQTIPRLGWEGYGIADVHIFALQGKTDAAFAAFQQAIDQGWRPIGQYPLDRDPNLAALREEPAFQAILDELEADMSAQLERVTAMDRAGELDPLPELAATP